MRKLAVAAAVLMLAGCASVPDSKQAAPKKPPAVKVAPVEQPTANQVVKKRWYDRFKKHPRFFH